MEDKKVFIVMTAFNRSALTQNTIDSIAKRRNLHIIVVDDSDKDPYSPEKAECDLVLIRNRKWVSPVITYNKGFEYIKNQYQPKDSDILIIQNSEAIHVGDIVQYAIENITEDNYISFACLSLPKDFCEQKITKERIDSVSNCHISATINDEIEVGWYNHEHYYPRALDFCSAITWGNMKKLNGFDERYAKHTWYGDDDFRNRVKKLGLTTIIGNSEMPFVCHQWHSRAHQPYGYTEDAMKLYSKTSVEDNYRAYHVITEDL